MRIEFTAAILLLIAFYAANTEGANVIYGVIVPQDGLLGTDYVERNSKWLRVISVDVSFPPRGYPNYRNLSAIRVMDWGGKKNFGYAYLAEGGPGYTYAKLHFKSQRSKGLNFTIQYLGHTPFKL